MKTGMGLLGFSPAGLMAEGFTGSPGMPTYTQNKRNPLQLDMSGWRPGAFGDSPRPMMKSMGSPQAAQFSPGSPVNYMAAPSMSPMSSMAKASEIPTFPGGGGGYPGLPVDPYAPGGSAPPGGPSAPPPSAPGAPSAPPPSAPPSSPPLGPNPWGGGYSGGNYPGGSPNAGNSPTNSAPFQPGQTGWGQLGPGNYTPMFSGPAQAYIQNALYQNYGGVPAPWLSQVDPNNYLASIGQLSGTPFNPALWGG